MEEIGISHWKDVDAFKNNHRNCKISTEMADETSNKIILECKTHAVKVLTYIPYRMFCLHPFKCAGLGSCPRNYACSE